MGFSKSSSEGRKRELRIFRWVLFGAAIAALGMHLSSAPLLVRFVNSVFSNLDLELPEDTIEVIVVDEEVPDLETPVTPPPPSEVATENEPAASAPEDSAPPLKTSESVIPTPPTAESIDTVPTESAIATETGVEGGEGAAGSADTMGLFSGDGSTEGDPTEPVGPPNVQQREPVERQPVQEVARARPPAARTVACNPCSVPDYPLSERRERIEGQPIINVVFDQNGTVIEAVVERSSGNTAFDQAALEEARTNWRFTDPYGLGGQVSVEVPFVITGSDQFEAATEAGQREAIELPVQQSIVPVTPAATGTAFPSTAERDPAPTVVEDASEQETEAQDLNQTPTQLPEESTPDSSVGDTSNSEDTDRPGEPTPVEAEGEPFDLNNETDTDSQSPTEPRETVPDETTILLNGPDSAEELVPTSSPDGLLEPSFPPTVLPSQPIDGPDPQIPQAVPEPESPAEGSPDTSD